MDNDLIEKVARAICLANPFDPDEVLAEDQGGGPTWTLYTSEATSAIRVVLEEAAKVAEMYPAAMIGGPDAYCRGHIAACAQTAAAIRAMMPKEGV